MHPTHVTIEKLKLDPANVRKTNKAAGVNFIANIGAVGIKVPLVVRKHGDGFYVTNGGKRLSAVEQIATKGGTVNGVPAKEYLLPIYVTDEDEKQALDTSLATNFIATPMHPVDEYEAFASLIDSGKSERDIAVTYGLPMKRVKQALALGNLHPKILKAWKEDILDQDAAQAFTLAPDQKAQETIFEKLTKGWKPGEDNTIDEYEISQALKANSNNAGKYVEFVGIEAYEKRGGKIDRDLFGVDHTVSDARLAKAMANEKLMEECTRLKADGWSFAVIEDNVQQSWNYGYISPKDQVATEAEQKRKEELTTLLAGVDEAEYTPEQMALSDELEMIARAVKERSWTPEQKKKSGCWVTVDDEGFLKISYGKVKPEQRKSVQASEALKPKKKPDAKKKTEKDKKPDFSLSHAVMQFLTETLTEAAGEVLATRTDLALPALLAGFSAGWPIDIDTLSNHGKFDVAFKGYIDGGQKTQLEALAKLVGGFVWLGSRVHGDAPLKAKGNQALCEALGAPLYLATKKHFDAKEYFNSVNRHIALKHMKEIFGAGYQAAWEKEKKEKIDKIALPKIKETGWLPPELRTSFYAGPGAEKKRKAA